MQPVIIVTSLAMLASFIKTKSLDTVFSVSLKIWSKLMGLVCAKMIKNLLKMDYALIVIKDFSHNTWLWES